MTTGNNTSGTPSFAQTFTFRHVVAVLSLALAVYSFSDREIGNALLSLLIAVASMLYEFAVKPYTYIRPVTTFLRKFYQKGDSLARTLMIVLASGGSALVIDLVYQISFLNLWDWLDTFVKRTAVVLVVMVPTFYLASLFSKSIYRISENVRDASIRVYESLFYFATTFFIAMTSLIGWGSPIENLLPSANRDAVVEWPIWAVPTRILLGVLAGIALVWMVALFFCVLSRKNEWLAVAAPPLGSSSGPNRGQSVVSTGEDLNVELGHTD